MKRHIIVLFVGVLLFPKAAFCVDFDIQSYDVSAGYKCHYSKKTFMDRNDLELSLYGYVENTSNCYSIINPNELYFLGEVKEIKNNMWISSSEHVGIFKFKDGLIKTSEPIKKRETLTTNFSQVLIYKPATGIQPLIVVFGARDFELLDDTSKGLFILTVFKVEPDGSIFTSLSEELGEWDFIFARDGKYRFVYQNDETRPYEISTRTGFVVDFKPKDGYGDVLIWKNNYVSAKATDKEFNFIKTGEEFYVMYYDKDSKTLKEPKEVKIDNSKELKEKLLWSKFAESDHNHGFTLSE